MTYFEYSEDRDPRDGEKPWDRHWTYERELRRSSRPTRLVIWSVKIECWERDKVPEGTPYFQYGP
jgi:hypothetical protein